MPRLHLIDAYALIFRAYYAFIRAPRINSKGQNTSAVFGFLNTFEEILRRENPTHLAVVFDPAGPTFRHKEFESYKANRDATPEDIHAAVPIIKELMAAYGVKVLQVAGYEADDVIGTLAVKGEREGYDVFMITPDKDYGQLVTDHISIIKPRTGAHDIETLGVSEITSRWGISSPSQVIDLLGLMGDTADNIPGCPGVGEKTAVRLIAQYGSIDGIIEHAAELRGSLALKVRDNVQQIRDSHYLATICTDVPVEFVPDEFVIAEQNKEALTRIFTDLEFKTHLVRLQPPTENPRAKPQQKSLFDDFVEPIAETPAPVVIKSNIDSEERDYNVVDSQEDIEQIVQELLSSHSVAFTIITDTQESMTCKPIGIALSGCDDAKCHKVRYIPLFGTDEDKKSKLQMLSPLFSSATIAKIGYGLKHQYIVLSRYGIDLCGRLFDCEVAHYLLQPEQKHNLDYLAFTLLDYQMMTIEAVVGPRGKAQQSLEMVAPDLVLRYVCEMTDVAVRLYNIMPSMLDDKELTKLFAEVEMPLVQVLARMEINGVVVNDFALSQISDQMTAKMNAIEQNIHRLAGCDINVSSPRQVGELLFDRLALLDKAKKTKSGQYSTDEETLESIRSKHPVVGQILEYRGLKKLLSTYIDALPRLINPVTGRVHTSYNQTVTATGRLSSSNPNLQNIPIRTDNGREIRRAFIPSEGCVFLSADYSQVELRIMAHLSADHNMIEAFLSNQDIHAATAAKIYHVPLDEVTDDMRRKAKTANFGIIYGISAFGLAERLSIPRSEAKELIDNYFLSFPEVKEFISKAVAKARQSGYAITPMNRRRYLPDISSRNAVVRSFAERNAVNAPIQGAAADIIKIAMVRIDSTIQAKCLKSKMILQVHDELNFEVPTDELETMTDIVRLEMENAYPLSVPLRVDIGTGSDWLEAH